MELKNDIKESEITLDTLERTFFSWIIDECQEKPFRKNCMNSHTFKSFAMQKKEKDLIATPVFVRAYHKLCYDMALELILELYHVSKISYQVSSDSEKFFAIKMKCVNKKEILHGITGMDNLNTELCDRYKYTIYGTDLLDINSDNEFLDQRLKLLYDLKNRTPKITAKKNIILQKHISPESYNRYNSLNFFFKEAGFKEADDDNTDFQKFMTRFNNIRKNDVSMCWKTEKLQEKLKDYHTIPTLYVDNNKVKIKLQSFNSQYDYFEVEFEMYYSWGTDIRSLILELDPNRDEILTGNYTDYISSLKKKFMERKDKV